MPNEAMSGMEELAGRETPFSRSRYLRHVPPVEGDLSTRRHWIIVHEPGRIPEKKGAFKWDRVNPFLRELIAYHKPEVRFVVVSLTWDFDVWVEDGRAKLAEDDAMDDYFRHESEEDRRARSRTSGVGDG